MSILLDPADGPRRDEYTQREMRLMHERDAALSHAEANNTEIARLHEVVAAQEACIAKLESKRRWSLPPAWLADELSFIDRCVRDEALHTLAERAHALARRLASEGTATASASAGPSSFEIELPLPNLTPEDLAEMRLVADIAASAGFTRIQINPKHSIALIDALNQARAELAAVYDAAFEAGECEVKPAVEKVRAIIDSRNDLCDRLNIINGAYETECARSDRYRQSLVFVKAALADESIPSNPRECEIDNVVRKALR